MKTSKVRVGKLYRVKVDYFTDSHGSLQWVVYGRDKTETPQVLTYESDFGIVSALVVEKIANKHQTYFRCFVGETDIYLTADTLAEELTAKKLRRLANTHRKI